MTPIRTVVEKNNCTPCSPDHLFHLSPQQYPTQPLPKLLPGHDIRLSNGSRLASAMAGQPRVRVNSLDIEPVERGALRDGLCETES